MIIGWFDIFKKELHNLFLIVRETPPSRGKLVRSAPAPQSQRRPLINIFAFDPLDNQSVFRHFDHFNVLVTNQFWTLGHFLLFFQVFSPHTNLYYFYSEDF